MSPKRLAKEDYTVGWICALPVPELKASRLLFDGEEHEDVFLDHKISHQYVYGEMNGHNVVMGCLPASQMGKASAASVATELFTTFPGLHFALIVGIGGAVPFPNDVRLGDVVVSLPDLGRQHGGVVQYDFGKAMHDGKFVKTGQLNQPPTSVLSGLGKLRSASARKMNFCHYLDLYKNDSYWDPGKDDRLFGATYSHLEGQATCEKCDLDHEQARLKRTASRPSVHYGLIASGDQVMKDAVKRDAISQKHGGILCFEMEAAGVANILPCLVVRGICDYCDSHKNKAWQPFAAAAAAAWAKELLGNIAPVQSREQGPIHQYDRHRTAQDVWMQKFVGQLTTTKRSVDDIRKLIGRISSYEARKILNRIGRKRMQGTTEWFTRAPAFDQWEFDSANSSILWLSGKVGSGKTVAMTAAVHHAMSTVQASRDTKVIHHFFQYPDTKAMDLFRSLTRQLIQISIDGNTPCPSELVHDLDLYFGDCNRSPDLDEIIDDIVIPLTYTINKLIVCVDGADTSDEHEQRYIWSGLHRLSEQRTERQKYTRIMITSENESQLATLVPANALRIRLDDGCNSKDIEMYIDTRLQERAGKRQLFHDRGLRIRVKDALLQRAENMFLWVHILLDEILRNCTTVAEVNSTLQDLPKSLSDLYLRCLTRRLDGQLLCNPKVLKWCSAAREPLCVDAVSDMLALDLESGEIDQDRRPDPDSVIRAGVSLLVLEETDLLLEPAHHSIRQFIFSNLLRDTHFLDGDFRPALQDELNMSRDQTELEIGQLCLSHIRAKTGIDIQIYRTVKAPPILGMIPQFLQKGLRLGQGRSEAPGIPIQRPTNQDTASFLQFAIQTWLLHTTKFDKTKTSWEKFEYVALQPNSSWKLHPWPAVGNTQISHLRGLLGYAVAQGHRPLLQLLMDQPTLLPRKVYDEVLPGNDLLPALHVAAKHGHVDLIPMLLKLCLINSLCPQHRRTALHVALEHGQDQFAIALCAFPGAKVDTLDARGVSPLALVIRNGPIGTIKTLLSGRRVRLDSKGNGLTSQEREDCIAWKEILLNKVDVHSKDVGGYTLLYRAFLQQNRTMAKLLIASQADVNPKDRVGKTPLNHAASVGDNPIVKLLVASEADVNTKDNLGWTPLHYAASRGDEATVELLLANQADVHAKNKKGRTPMEHAASQGHKAIVKTLLNKSKTTSSLVRCEQHDKQGRSV
ncbi:hypothetical protein M409DRAFT_15659 [Zasmidium cellare ATCC 36951]|uniref:Nephrocystin 3-like N-terminal domain-containing protein n=1 Tax=Zasmidium cellare ATCC 36951 TaxID=1080233 RepID=A0A6A6D1S1_ZASCE|nr:uncharacterized protein M409DRAFT_15659 [Zasmidium cellare ATCC 36951]KAF2173374.1 hypothetical protein M409DRAFT_15659 [Zasmidium cellare ATCC 36951]